MWPVFMTRSAGAQPTARFNFIAAAAAVLRRVQAAGALSHQGHVAGIHDAADGEVGLGLEEISCVAGRLLRLRGQRGEGAESKEKPAFFHRHSIDPQV